MSVKRFSMLIVAFFALFLLAGSAAWAQTPTCQPGNAIDTAAKQNAASVGQAKDKDLASFWSGLPKVDVNNSYCGKMLIDAYNTFVNGLQGVTDPGAVIGGLLGSALGNFLNSTCTSIVGTAAGSANSLTALARICIPISSFGFGGFNGLNLTGCSGGTTFSLISSNPNAPTNFGSSWGLNR